MVLLALLLGFVQACGEGERQETCDGSEAKPKPSNAVRLFEVATFGVATGLAIQGMGSMACNGVFL